LKLNLDSDMERSESSRGLGRHETEQM
jgi:hypothetical protein